jgi:hypothetical protein
MQNDAREPRGEPAEQGRERPTSAREPRLPDEPRKKHGDALEHGSGTRHGIPDAGEPEDGK